MADRSNLILEMQQTMEKVLEIIEENFHNDSTFRSVRKLATEMKAELEEVLDTFED
jgi:hypothetical protein